VLGVVVFACVGYLVYSATGTSAEYYQTVSELKAHPSSGQVRVLGVVQDDVHSSQGGRHVEFTIEDGGETLPVAYTGQLPDIFRPGARVVVEGRQSAGGVFHATSVLAKCPSRFSSTSPAQ
jgi:cytochrome c-type biogenesis protein CcmE